MSRETIVDQWLTQVLPGNSLRREAMTGDASFRRYFRVYAGNKRFVLMDAPPPENPSIFTKVAEILQSQGLSVPEILASHPEGMLLLTDFGDRLYLNELNENTAPKLYHDALHALVNLHQCEGEVPDFDLAFLTRQLNIFKEWYLGHHLNLRITPEIESMLTRLVEFFAEIMQEQPFVFVHRDYHSRNLMILDQGNPGILDFQDAMRGPITYDLVSLLQDCYITWPREKVLQWIKEFMDYAKKAKILPLHITETSFVRWFDLTGVHRHLKNLGIFTRLNYRDQKPHYLNDLKIPLQHIVTACDHYEELEELKRFIDVFEVEKVSKCAP